MKKYYLCLIIIIFLTGCSNYRVIDRVQIIQALGYDLKDDKITGTVIYPTFEEQGKNVFHIISTESTSFDEIFVNLNTKSPYPIDNGQLRTVLFNVEFGKEGIDQVIHFLSKDPVLGSRMQMGITEPKAEEVMELSALEKVPAHLYDKINQNIQNGSLPRMNLHVFLSDFYNEGKDPVLPYFIIEGGIVKIDGLALFKKSKYINHINLKQTFLLKLLKDDTKDGRFEAGIHYKNRDGSIFLRNLSSKTKFNLQLSNPSPSLSINLTLKTQIKRVPKWINLKKNNDVKKTEKILESYFNEEIQRLITLFQEYEIDPIGFGELIKANSRNWDYESYHSMYPELVTTVNTKVEILQTGVEE